MGRFERPGERRHLAGIIRRATQPVAGLLVGMWLVAHPVPLGALRVGILTSIGGLPAHVTALFEQPAGFQQGPGGAYFVFDRRGHAVYRIEADKNTARRIITIGQEDGRIIDPTAFDLSDDGRIVVSDVPRGRQRVQVFDAEGMRLAGFFLQGQPAARVVLGGVMLNGVGTIQFSARGLLLSHPESGALITGYTPAGYGTTTVGLPRPTAFEHDRELHLAMNAGFPLADPTGGYYYVFMTGRPAFRKYDAAGNLVFERLIQGVELDPVLEAQPTEWPRRRVYDREVPFVAPVIRTAAVSPAGELWISLSIPFTYVYDAQGDKVRTLQFRAAGILGPTSLAFTRRQTVLVTPGCYEFSARP